MNYVGNSMCKVVNHNFIILPKKSVVIKKLKYSSFRKIKIYILNVYTYTEKFLGYAGFLKWCLIKPYFGVFTSTTYQEEVAPKIDAYKAPNSRGRLYHC